MKQRRDKSTKSIQRRHDPSATDPHPTRPDRQPFKAPGPIEALNIEQDRYLKALKGMPLVFGIGPAGTGKSYIAASFAAQQLEAGLIQQIILVRPAQESGEKLGHLPGELEDKYGPYIEPFIDALNERLGRSHVENLRKNGRILPSPLAYMRGKTFKNAIAILDEAQNTTPEQMKMFLSRAGENCTIIVNGDPNQIDIKGPSGLIDALENRAPKIPAARVVRLVKSVRSDLCQQVIDAYES